MTTRNASQTRCRRPRVPAVTALFVLALSAPAHSQVGFLAEKRVSAEAAPATTIVGDFNGDGFGDVAAFTADGGGGWKVRLGNGKGTLEAPETWGPKQGVNDGVWAGDFNGDGLTDKVSLIAGGDAQWRGFWVSEAGRETGSGRGAAPRFGFGAESRWSSDAPGGADQAAAIAALRIGDFNGDGKDDIAYPVAGGQSGTWSVLIAGRPAPGKGAFAPAASWGAVKAGCDWKTAPVVCGDFDGDGRADLATRCGTDGGWHVASSSGASFAAWKSWGKDASTRASNHVAADFDGDGRDDIASFVPASGSTREKWYVSASGGGGFAQAKVWQTGGGTPAGAWAADLNGDGRADKMTSAATGAGGAIALTESKNTAPREVGVWYTLWWYPDRWKESDAEKVPVVGWGSDTLAGRYRTSDIPIIQRQVRAMKRAGIDFIVADLTNGLAPMEPPWQHNPGDAASSENLDRLFAVMKGFPAAERIPVAVALGLEFWGRYTICAYPPHAYDSWENQRKRQTNAVNRILQKYARQETYYRYLGKPLLLEYFSLMEDYPYRDENFDPAGRNNFPQFTVRQSAAWGATHAHWTPSTWAPAATCAPARSIFLEGMDTKPLWGWGAGTPDDAGPRRPIPRNVECMAIMPGTHRWSAPYDWPMKRRKGDFYTDQWRQVLEAMPRKVLIADWNNWNEETAIEGCIGPGGWTDKGGRPTYDWYLQITQAYAHIYKKGALPANTYVQEEGTDGRARTQVYLWNGSCLESAGNDFQPENKPVIKLPAGWLGAHDCTPCK